MQSFFPVFIPIFLILVIYESIAVWKFHQFIFKLGICALFKQEVVHDGVFKNVGEVGETENGRYKVISPNEVLFYYYKNPFSLKLRVSTPMVLKGSVIFEKGICRISGRVLIFPTLFFAFWSFGLLFIAHSVFSKSNGIPVAFVAIVSFMLTVPLGMIVFSTIFEKRRFMHTWEEVRRRVL